MNPLPRARRALAACLLAAAPLAHAAPPEVGDVPPALVGRTLGGDALDLTLPRFHGKAVVISYWASWCPYCLKELPVLDAIQKKAGADHMQVIAIDTEPYEVFRRVSRLLASQLALQLAYDPDGAAQAAYGVKGIPHMVIIGQDGHVQAVFQGYSDERLDDIVAAINHATGATP